MLDLKKQRPRLNVAGINIDLEPPRYAIETLPPPEKAEAKRLIHDALPHFIALLKKDFVPAHLMVTEDLPAVSPDLDYKKLSEINDLVVILLYDQNIANPGPIAGQDWIEQRANDLFAKMDSSKVILGIANYCYDWAVAYDKSGNLTSHSPPMKPQPQMATVLSWAREAGGRYRDGRSESQVFLQ